MSLACPGRRPLPETECILSEWQGPDLRHLEPPKKSEPTLEKPSLTLTANAGLTNRESPGASDTALSGPPENMSHATIDGYITSEGAGPPSHEHLALP